MAQPSASRDSAREDAETARRQYTTGVLNRRIMTNVASLDRLFSEVTGESGAATVFCACGREGCAEAIEVPIEVYEEFVRHAPHRFVVAPRHAMPIDEVLVQADAYDIVEIKPTYRDPNPVTADRTR